MIEVISVFIGFNNLSVCDIVPGSGHGFGQKCSFPPQKKRCSFGKNKFAHINQCGSEYKIMQKSQIQTKKAT